MTYFLLPWWERYSVFAVYYLLQVEDTIPRFIYWLAVRGQKLGPARRNSGQVFHVLSENVFKPYSIHAKITSNVFIMTFFETLGSVSPVYFLLTI